MQTVICCVAGPKAMVLAGALGAGLMSIVQFGVKPFYPQL